MPVIDVELLIRGAFERRVATPLIGHHSPIHQLAGDAQDHGIEEKLRPKAGWIKRHRQEVTPVAAVGLVSISLEIVQQNGPKCVPATADQRGVEVPFENAEALVCELGGFLVARSQFLILAQRADRIDARRTAGRHVAR